MWQNSQLLRSRTQAGEVLLRSFELANEQDGWRAERQILRERFENHMLVIERLCEAGVEHNNFTGSDTEPATQPGGVPERMKVAEINTPRHAMKLVMIVSDLCQHPV